MKQMLPLQTCGARTLYAALLATAFSAAAFGASTFQFQSTILRDSYSPLSYLVVGDLNGDGKPDLLTTDTLNRAVYLLFGKGDGTFLGRKTLKLNSSPLPVVLGDFNGDGHLDIAIGEIDIDGENPQVEIWLGAGDGTFANAAAVPLKAAPLALAIGDFNRDGKLDIVVEEASARGFDISNLTNIGSGSVEVFAGDGKGSMRSVFKKSLSAAGGLKMVVGDWNHDGTPDLALNQLVEGGVVVMLGLGNGQLADPVFYPGIRNSDFNGLQLAAADLDQDGNPDLVMTTGHDNAIVIFYGNPDGTFQAAKTLAVHDAGGLAIADFDGDGSPDLAVGTTAGFDTIMLTGNPPTTPDPVVIIPGGAHGAFGTPTAPLGQAYIPLIVETADFNGDGLPDLVADNVFSSSVTIMLNQTPQASQPFAVVSAAAKSAALAPEELASGYGTNLASGVFFAQLPLPDDFGRIDAGRQGQRRGDPGGAADLRFGHPGQLRGAGGYGFRYRPTHAARNSGGLHQFDHPHPGCRAHALFGQLER